MKKSNKLLLGGLLTVILLVAGIHIALFAKYKNGNYTIYHPQEEKPDSMIRKFQNISFVTIRNVPGATIRFGDMAEVEKDREGLIHYEQKGDTLIITGKGYYEDQLDRNSLANFTLPYNVTIETDSISRVSLQSNHILKAKITTVSNTP